jgi:hypothetical protein
MYQHSFHQHCSRLHAMMVAATSAVGALRSGPSPREGGAMPTACMKRRPASAATAVECRKGSPGLAGPQSFRPPASEASSPSQQVEEQPWPCQDSAQKLQSTRRSGTTTRPARHAGQTRRPISQLERGDPLRWPRGTNAGAEGCAGAHRRGALASATAAISKRTHMHGVASTVGRLC